MRMLTLAERSTRRGSASNALRSQRVYTTLTALEASRFDRLREILGMNRSQALRFLILKDVAFAMGRRLSGARIGAPGVEVLQTRD